MDILYCFVYSNYLYTYFVFPSQLIYFCPWSHALEMVFQLPILTHFQSPSFSISYMRAIFFYMPSSLQILVSFSLSALLHISTSFSSLCYVQKSPLLVALWNSLVINSIYLPSKLQPQNQEEVFSLLFHLHLVKFSTRLIL